MSDKQVKTLQTMPINPTVMQGSTTSFPILMSAMREYKYRFQTSVYHYAEDTSIIKKGIPLACLQRCHELTSVLVLR